ncbi:hypothetical protein C1631_001685 [Chryseobacterium phosphatilyticum]|uniref:Uncharacterized protein n=1 Tax=Chryseobacterium phosphatilyticum TaxID=475075 RepID=A0A316XKF5_9FLAO|nr:hypothetical protein [Chryseobacterium phosphatilyticum]PWN71360.1 hypothetical protein C1631_001685 [Chryseobacterium phosphatilyticum]
MATYESLIKIKGAVGDLVFYNLNGKNVVRKKSGFNKTAFKKNASYEKVRQNSSEFGHCSKIGKIIRNSLDFYIKAAGDPLLYQKFARVMTEIKDLDTVSERGKRTVENGLKTIEGKNILTGFQLGEIENLSTEVKIKGQRLYLNENNKADEATIITIKLDSESYIAEHTEEKVFLSQPEAPFKKQFTKDDFLLYFVVLKKNNEITHMGFI